MVDERITETTTTFRAYSIEIDGETFSWNASSIEIACRAGTYGAAKKHPMSDWQVADDAYSHGHISLHRVEAIMRDPKRLNDPVILLDFFPRPRGPKHRLVVEGTHRLEARRRLGLRRFRAWLVPAESELLYRVGRDAVFGSRDREDHE